MIKKFLVCCLAALSLVAGMAHAGDAEIRKAMASLGLTPDEVRKTEPLGLYEVRIGDDLWYADDKGSYLIHGDIIDVKARANLTEVRRNKLAQIKFSDLPLELAVKTTRGNGKRIFATFEDPNCGYCKKLAKDMVGMNDITMYTFLLPILSPDSREKSKAIWCAADRSKAWSDWMVNGTAPAAANCTVPIDKVLALAEKYKIHGTPTIFLANGERIPGAVPVARLEQDLNRVALGK
jgi:thiol:disulfide interchange protein DsbC